MLRTAYQIMDKFNGVELDNCPIIGGRAIKFPDGDVLILEPNLRLELGNVVRIKSVSDSRQDESHERDAPQQRAFALRLQGVAYEVETTVLVHQFDDGHRT